MITEITPDGQEIKPASILIGKEASFNSTAEDRENRKKYSFTWFEDAKFSGFQDKEVQDLLFKW